MSACADALARALSKRFVSLSQDVPHVFAYNRDRVCLAALRRASRLELFYAAMQRLYYPLQRLLRRLQ